MTSVKSRNGRFKVSDSFFDKRNLSTPNTSMGNKCDGPDLKFINVTKHGEELKLVNLSLPIWI